MSAKTKLFWLIVFIVANGAVILITALNEFSPSKSEGTISPQMAWRIFQSHAGYLLLALGCFLTAILVETLKYTIIIYTTTNEWRPKLALETLIVGRYYDNITPMGAGGQPFQVFSLRKHNLDMGKCTSIPIMSFIINQMCFSVLALVSLTLGTTVEGITPWVRAAAWLGIVCYMGLPLILIFISALPRYASGMVHGIIRLWHKIRPKSDLSAMIARSDEEVTNYIEALRGMWKNKKALALEILCSLTYNALIFLIPFFVLLAFDEHINPFTIITTCCIIYSAISFVPTPGNSGAAEGLFYIIFSSLAVSGTTFWCMLTWRIFSYYTFLFAGFALMLVQFVQSSIRKRREKRMLPPQDKSSLPRQ